jgi:Carboxypeptidase regulatory-like domain
VIPGAHVVLSLGESSRETKADDNGKYNFPDLRPGRYHVTAKLMGFSPDTVIADLRNRADLALPPIMLELAGPCSEISVTVPHYRVEKILGQTAEVAGRIKPPRGADVVLKTISGGDVTSAIITPNKRGEFRFTGLPPGEHRLYVTPIDSSSYVSVNPMRLISHPGELLVLDPIRLKRAMPPKPGEPVVICE